MAGPQDDLNMFVASLQGCSLSTMLPNLIVLRLKPTMEVCLVR